MNLLVTDLMIKDLLGSHDGSSHGSKDSVSIDGSDPAQLNAKSEERNLDPEQNSIEESKQQNHGCCAVRKTIPDNLHSLLSLYDTMAACKSGSLGPNDIRLVEALPEEEKQKMDYPAPHLAYELSQFEEVKGTAKFGSIRKRSDASIRLVQSSMSFQDDYGESLQLNTSQENILLQHQPVCDKSESSGAAEPRFSTFENKEL